MRSSNPRVRIEGRIDRWRFIKHFPGHRSVALQSLTTKHTAFSSSSSFSFIVTQREEEEIVQSRRVATTEEEGIGGEARNSRLQVFLSSLLSTIGGVFGSTTSQEESHSLTMASRAIVAPPHQQPQPRGMLLIWVIMNVFVCICLFCFL